MVGRIFINLSPPPHSSQDISVLLGQEDGGDGAVSLGDDPNPPSGNVVGAEDPVAISQSDLVLVAVEGAEVSPVPCGMAGDVAERVLLYIREEFQGPRSGHYPS